MNKIKWIGSIPLLVIFILGMFSHIMTGSLGHDEHMFVTAGDLFQKLTLYHDFGFLQMPYLPIIYGIFNKLTNTTHHLLVGRISSFLFMCAATFLLFLIARRITQENYISIIASIFFSLNLNVLMIQTYAWNSIMPISFSLLGLYLYISSIFEDRIKTLMLLFSGISLGIAIGSKLYYLAVLLPFLLISLLHPASLSFRERFRRIFSPFSFGVLTGLLPILYYVVYDFNNFIFDNLTYHTINTQWRNLTGYNEGMTFAGKLSSAGEIIASPSNLVILVALSFLIILRVYGFWQDKSRQKLFHSMPELLALSLATISLVTTFVPTPFQQQYITVPLPYVIILIISLYHGQFRMKRSKWRLLFSGLAFVNLIVCGSHYLKDIPQLLRPEKWTGISVHTTAVNIRDSIGKIGEDQKIATLSPLYIVEADLPLYPEFATGPFLYRVGDLIPEPGLSRIVSTSRNSLETFFNKNPPKAIFVGFEGELDLPFIQYAVEHHYKKINGNFSGGTLFISNI